TGHFVVLVEFPLVVDPLRLALSNRPYIENYRWEPERGTRVWLIDRGDGEVAGPFETDAAFAFHHVNAFERDGEVVVDMCVYDDAEIIRALYLERLRNPDPEIPLSRLERWRIDPAARRVTREPVFVPRPDGEDEDDGVALSIVLDAERGRSFLLVLDGATFTERARAGVLHHIPFGFHGQFFGSLT